MPVPVAGSRSVNTARKEAKRERILDAAVLEIARHGYFGTTVSTIAGRAGVADGTIYLYFKNKEDILVSIFERAMDLFSVQAQKIADDDGNAEHKLRRIIALHLSLLGEDRDLAVIFQVEFRHTLHVLEMLSRSRIRDYLALIASVVEQGRAEGVFKADADSLLTPMRRRAWRATAGAGSINFTEEPATLLMISLRKGKWVQPNTMTSAPRCKSCPTYPLIKRINGTESSSPFSISSTRPNSEATRRGLMMLRMRSCPLFISTSV